jgi:hypothetical protein
MLTPLPERSEYERAFHLLPGGMGGMKHIRSMLLAATLALAACSTTYYTYSGSPVYTGQGGASKNVNGIDFWVIGTPPRKFRIIGYIEDSRKRGLIENATRDPNVADKAKAAGGDAVIRTGDFEQYVGTVSSATGNAYTTGNASFVGNTAQFNASTTASGTAVSIPIFWHNSQYLVIKYVN